MDNNEDGRKDQMETGSTTQENTGPQSPLERAKAEMAVNMARLGYGNDINAYLRDISAWH